jgi:hypothetical protein
LHQWERLCGKKTAGHYRLPEGFSYAGAPFHLSIVKRGTWRYSAVRAIFSMDTHYSDAMRLPAGDIVLRIIE